MIFAYHPKTSDQNLSIDGELFSHLIRARRHKVGDKLLFSALDEKKSCYEISQIEPKKAQLSHISTKTVLADNLANIQLAWCVVDSHTVKNFLPYFNQLGLKKITFVMADRSQKHFKPKLEKLNKILIHSCEQCGRYDLMQLDFAPNIETLIKQYPDTFMLNFNGQNIQDQTKGVVANIMVGPEGGFSPRECNLFPKDKILSLPSPYVLKSENAGLIAISHLL